MADAFTQAAFGDYTDAVEEMPDTDSNQYDQGSDGENQAESQTMTAARAPAKRLRVPPSAIRPAWRVWAEGDSSPQIRLRAALLLLLRMTYGQAVWLARTTASATRAALR